MTRWARLWLPAIVWMGAIFVVSAQPSVPSVPGRWDLILKKMLHIAAYGILTWLYLRALRENASDHVPVRLVAAMMAVLYALTDEYHQTFVSGRNGTLVDVAIDGLGVIGVILLDAFRTGDHVAASLMPSE